jgi:hypothetical protein
MSYGGAGRVEVPQALAIAGSSADRTFGNAFRAPQSGPGFRNAKKKHASAIPAALQDAWNPLFLNTALRQC